MILRYCHPDGINPPLSIRSCTVKIVNRICFALFECHLSVCILCLTILRPDICIVFFSGQSDMEQSSSYPVDMPYHGHGLAHSHTSNGHPDNSPSSSHLSLPSEVPQVVRSQKQQTTQQVSLPLTILPFAIFLSITIFFVGLTVLSFLNGGQTTFRLTFLNTIVK